MPKPDHEADERVEPVAARGLRIPASWAASTARQIALGGGRRTRASACGRDEHLPDHEERARRTRPAAGAPCGPTARRRLARSFTGAPLLPRDVAHDLVRRSTGRRRLADVLTHLGDRRVEDRRLAGVVGRSPRSTATTSVIRPGRGDITTTRSDRNTASGIEWVTNTTVVPVSAAMRSSSSCMCSRVISSSAPNGSSISSSAGRAASARAIATRCCMPPDSCHGRDAGEVGQPDQLEQLRRPRPPLCRCAHAVQFQRQLDVRRDRAPLEQRRTCWNAIP